MLPATDHPEAFGQHPNADIASQITETRTLFETLLSLQGSDHNTLTKVEILKYFAAHSTCFMDILRSICS